MDGHSSHVNLEFINYCDQNRILILILPPHSTHRLQPLDVGVFGPLLIAYSNQLNSLQHKSLGLVSMTKRLFYPLFREAFKEAFSKEHIERSFEKTGIWPFNPSIVINVIAKPNILQPEISPKPQTPITSYTIRRIHR